jgi:hypothetical protein
MQIIHILQITMFSYQYSLLVYEEDYRCKHSLLCFKCEDGLQAFCHALLRSANF